MAPDARPTGVPGLDVQGRYRGARIGVLLGGLSSEREISDRSGRAVLAALREAGYDVVEVPTGRDLGEVLAREGVEVAFNALHGRYGEDGCVQGVLEVLGIPYTGAGVRGSSVAMDKWMSRVLFEAAGVPVAQGALVGPDGDTSGIPDLPVVVKPRGEGSSLGVAIVREPGQLGPAIEAAQRLDREALVEAFVPGREVTVAVLDGRALAAMEVVALGDDFHTYDVKYTHGREEFRLPAPLGDVYEPVLELSERAHRAVDAGSYSRVDLRVREDGRAFVLECNTLPGLHDLGWFTAMAAHAGLSFVDLVEIILDRATLGVSETRLQQAVGRS